MKTFERISVFCFFILLKLTGCIDEEPLQLGSGYKLSFNHRGGRHLISDSKNRVLIDEHILNYSFDSTFIIASQRALDSISECKYKTNETLNDCKEAFEKSTFQQYWIINKKQKSIFNERTATYSNVYGPYNKEEYVKKKQELDVPPILVLKTE